MLRRLLISTALTVPAFAMPAMAQDQNACNNLMQESQDGIPESLDLTRDDIMTIADEGDIARCEQVLADWETATSGTATAEAEIDAEGRLAETDQLTVTLEDERVVEGMVFLEQEPPQVDVAPGETEVVVSSQRPQVSVTQEAAEIIVRQQAPQIELDMPQPTITITQAAPEIIITMPEPGVDVTASRPQVEVRQAEPQITVNQAPPTVNLELRTAESAEGSPGIQVQDRQSGETYAQGEAREPRANTNAQINLAQADPTVIFEEDSEADPAEIQISRAEPSVRFEAAEPELTFTSSGEPQVTFEQQGEVQVTLRQAGEEESGTQTADASDQTQPMEGEQTAEADQSNLMQEESSEESQTADAQTETDSSDTQLQTAEAGTLTTEGEQDEQMAEADSSASMQTEAETADASTMTETTETEQTASADVQRDGYDLVRPDQIEMSTLTGASVYDTNDENVGEIGELLLGANGEIDRAIIDVGGFLGLGEKPVAVEMQNVAILRNQETDNLRVYVQTNRADLESQPRYEGE
ncbi:PRC-barrel domain-containing protein [Aestuariibius sp. 2305UL40-4]|uniref:PRC-barrel domain-containing protein n=1 Tax=Aestuariibius violaceus TaxID=3234132 RepID=UPI00345EB8A0